MLTSIAYLPGVGLALAGTTLVGQAIGRGRSGVGRGARQLGDCGDDRLHGAVGVLLAVLGPWVMPAVS